MLAVDDEVAAALRTHQTGGVEATAFYLGAVTIPHLLIPSGSISFTGDGRVQARGSVLAVGEGESRVPVSKTDALATYGQEVSIRRTVEVNGVPYEIPLGRYRVTEAADGEPFYRDDVPTGWAVSLTVQDRFEQIDADDFLAPESPTESTTWAELRRLSPVPVVESLPGVSVPASTAYRSRMDAIITLCELMGGLPHLTREGVLTARPKDAWLTSTTEVFDIKGVVKWSDRMSNDFFNQVAVRSSSNNNLVAYRAITEPWNPLAVSRAGGRTFTYSSPLLLTQEAVDAAADTVLARVSQKRSKPVDVECGPEALLLELGDYGRVTDTRTGRSAVGEVFSIRVPLDPTATIGVQLVVAEES